MSSRWIMAATAACTSLLLAACVPGLSDDAGLYFGRGSGSIPISEGQTTEVHIGSSELSVGDRVLVGGCG